MEGYGSFFLLPYILSNLQMPYSQLAIVCTRRPTPPREAGGQVSQAHPHGQGQSLSQASDASPSLSPPPQSPSPSALAAQESWAVGADRPAPSTPLPSAPTRFPQLLDPMCSGPALCSMEILGNLLLVGLSCFKVGVAL